MPQKLLVNLPVKDAQASTKFFKALGLMLNEKLSDEKAICFNVADNIVIALLPTDHFREIISGNEVADATKVNETVLVIETESQDEVDSLLASALAVGGKELHEPYDLEEIYGRTFADLDGHQWNIFYAKAE